LSWHPSPENLFYCTKNEYNLFKITKKFQFAFFKVQNNMQFEIKIVITEMEFMKICRVANEYFKIYSKTEGYLKFNSEINGT